MYQLAGYRVPRQVYRGRRRFLGTVVQAATTGGAAVGAGAATAAIAGTSIVTGLATAGIGAGIGILLALFAAHEARVAGAKDENAAVNIAAPNAQSELQQIVSLYNSGQLTAQQALQYTAQVASNFQSAIAPHQTGAGQHATTCAASGSTPCNKNCTAGCCVYCNTILQWVSAVTQAISAGGGTAQLSGISGLAKYNGIVMAPITLTVTAPAAGSAAGVAGVASDLTSGTVAGIPVWLLVVVAAGAAYAYR